MQIEILQSRAYRVIGAKVAGETCVVPDALGKQLIAQKFARQIRPKPGPAETRPTAALAEKTEPDDAA